MKTPLLISRALPTEPCEANHQTCRAAAVLLLDIDGRKKPLCMAHFLEWVFEKFEPADLPRMGGVG